VTKKRLKQKRSQANKIYPAWELIKKISTLLSILIILIVLILGCIWLAGSQLFTLDNNKYILFASSKIDSSKAKIYLAYFLPSEQKILIFPLQSQLVGVIGGYGEYQLSAVYPLLKMEKKDNRFQSAAMSWGVGVVIDEVSELSLALDLESKNHLQKQLIKMVIDNFVHSKSLVESLQLFFFTRSVPAEQVRIETRPVSIDQLATFTVSMIYEDCLVAVVNTTNKVGLAAEMSKILEKSGVVVVRVTDQSSPYQLSNISYAVDNLACQVLADRAVSLFPNQVVKQDSPQLRQEYRADLVILIGEDLAKRMN